MLKRILLLTALLCIVAFMGAERRALVIGNANYTEGRLKNPVNDARAVGALLRNLGFETTVKTDLNRRNLEFTPTFETQQNAVQIIQRDYV